MVTTSGMCSAEPLNCALAALGPSRVMFAADYPFEVGEEAGEFHRSRAVCRTVRADIAFNNAAKSSGLARVARRMTIAMTKVLIVDVHAEIYRDRLRRRISGAAIRAVSTTRRQVSGRPVRHRCADLLRHRRRRLDPQPRHRLKWIQSLATGVDHFLHCPSLRPDVLITSGRGIHGPAMREEVLYLMMAVSRDAPRRSRTRGARIWERRLWSTSRQDRGRRRHRRHRHRDRRIAQGARHDRHRRHPHAARRSRVLTRYADGAVGRSGGPRRLPDQCAAGGRTDNIGLFDAEVFAAMKPSAYYINAGRGQTVDEAALIAALRERRIAGAGLDVFGRRRCRPTARSGICPMCSSPRMSAAMSLNTRI